MVSNAMSELEIGNECRRKLAQSVTYRIVVFLDTTCKAKNTGSYTTITGEALHYITIIGKTLHT